MQTLRGRSSRPEATALRTAPAAVPPRIGCPLHCWRSCPQRTHNSLSPSTRNAHSPFFLLIETAKKNRNKFSCRCTWRCCPPLQQIRHHQRTQLPICSPCLMCCKWEDGARTFDGACHGVSRLLPLHCCELRAMKPSQQRARPATGSVLGRPTIPCHGAFRDSTSASELMLQKRVLVFQNSRPALRKVLKWLRKLTFLQAEGNMAPCWAGEDGPNTLLKIQKTLQFVAQIQSVGCSCGQFSSLFGNALWPRACGTIWRVYGRPPRLQSKSAPDALQRSWTENMPSQRSRIMNCPSSRNWCLCVGLGKVAAVVPVGES